MLHDLHINDTLQTRYVPSRQAGVGLDRLDDPISNALNQDVGALHLYRARLEGAQCSECENNNPRRVGKT